MDFYNFSGGMESAAMLVAERERLLLPGVCVRHADTGKQFPEAKASREQIASILGINIIVVPRRITFDEFLFEKGGMIRKGTTDCSRRMKRSNLKRHMLGPERAGLLPLAVPANRSRHQSQRHLAHLRGSRVYDPAGHVQEDGPV
jgi:3'-phosphoadenosine 5'-phosphosulfate sulfotransferase (PAPS reductase)/FAD synthetase